MMHSSRMLQGNSMMGIRARWGAHVRRASERNSQRHEQALALALLRLAQRLHPALEALGLAQRPRQLAAVVRRQHRLRDLRITTSPQSLNPNPNP